MLYLLQIPYYVLNGAQYCTPRYTAAIGIIVHSSRFYVSEGVNKSK